jgi:hypothetical protein
MATELTELPESLRDGLNSTGSTIVAKRIVTGQADAISLPGADTDAVYGVTRGDVKDKAHGSIMVRGKAIITAGTGGVTKGQRIKPEAATGKGITWGSAKSIVGVAMTTAAADADFECELLGPGATGA